MGFVKEEETVNFPAPRCHLTLHLNPASNRNTRNPSHRVCFQSQATRTKQQWIFPLLILLRNSVLPLVMDATEGLETAVLADVTAVTAETLLVESDCITGEEQETVRTIKEEKRKLWQKTILRINKIFAMQILGMSLLATFSSICNLGPLWPTVTKSYSVSKGIFKHHLSSSSALYLCS